MSGLARSAPVDCAEDTALTRMRFLTEHLHDLQSLRWMVPQVALIAVPLLMTTPYKPSVRAARLFALALVVASAAWFFGFRAYIRRTYGRTRLSREQRLRRRVPSPIVTAVILVFTLMNFVWRFGPYHSRSNDWGMTMWVVVMLLWPIPDKTNLPVRRAAYAAALVSSVLCYLWLASAGVPQEGQPPTALPVSCFGVTLLLLSLFDFRLIRSIARGAAA